MNASSRRRSVLVLMLAMACLPGDPLRAAEPTVLEATLDLKEAFQEGVSLMWSPCGQAAWDSLLQYHGVKEIDMNPNSVTAEVLNAFRLDKASVLPTGTVIFAGDDSEAFRQRIRDDLRKRIGEAAAAMIGPMRPAGLVQREPPVWRIKSALVVSAISCKPRFPCDFVPDPDPRIFTDRAGHQFRTLGFGSSGKHSATYDDAVRVLEDDLAGTNALRFAFFTGEGGTPECLVLSTGGKHKNLESALVHVRDLLRQERVPEKVVEKQGKRWRYTDTLWYGDTLWVPHLSAAMCSEYPDLIGKKYLEHKVNNLDYWWQIAEATQLLNVRLDHKGALVQAVFQVSPDFLSAAGGASGGLPPPEKLPLYPKSFAFDKPFVASLWREGADWPYLACWVDGPDVLVLAK